MAKRATRCTERSRSKITAIPELIENLDIKGSTVSIDAIGCQKSIAKKIIDKSADYLLALKKNQKESFEQVEDAFRFHSPKTYDQTIEKDHGREETRKCTIISVDTLPKEEIPIGWQELKTLVRVESIRKINETIEQETRYYLSSDATSNPKYYNILVRGHWSIENHLHWHLDVTFNEEASRARSGNVPLNLNILRKIALQRISSMTDKISKQKRRFRASLNNAMY